MDNADDQPPDPVETTHAGIALVKRPERGVKPKRLNKDEQVALARAVQLRVILGRTTEEIAAEFNIAKSKVKAKLAEARKDGGAKDVAEVLVLERLLPKAVAVFDAALSGEDIPKGTLDVAKDVLFGSGTLKKKDEVAVTHDVSPLEAYRREREARLTLPVAEVDVIDAAELEQEINV